MKLSPTTKRQMLKDAIILCYNTGTYAGTLIGHELSYYDFDGVFELIKSLNKENIEMGGNDLFEFEDNYYGYQIK